MPCQLFWPEKEKFGRELEELAEQAAAPSPLTLTETDSLTASLAPWRTTLLTVSSSGACPGLCNAQEKFLEGEESREPVKQSWGGGLICSKNFRSSIDRSPAGLFPGNGSLIPPGKEQFIFFGAARFAAVSTQSSRCWIRMDRRVLLGGSWSSLKIDPSRFGESRGDICSVDLLVFWVARILSEYFLGMCILLKNYELAAIHFLIIFLGILSTQVINLMSYFA
jgi:hypothetical protein